MAPFGLLIGALGALPSNTEGPECSENASYFRKYVVDGFDQQLELAAEGEDEDEIAKETALAFYNAGTYLDEVGPLCRQSLYSTIDEEYAS